MSLIFLLYTSISFANQTSVQKDFQCLKAIRGLNSSILTAEVSPFRTIRYYHRINNGNSFYIIDEQGIPFHCDLSAKGAGLKWYEISYPAEQKHRKITFFKRYSASTLSGSSVTLRPIKPKMVTEAGDVVEQTEIPKVTCVRSYNKSAFTFLRNRLASAIKTLPSTRKVLEAEITEYFNKSSGNYTPFGFTEGATKTQLMDKLSKAYNVAETKCEHIEKSPTNHLSQPYFDYDKSGVAQ